MPVILSPSLRSRGNSAKDLARRTQRSFASLRMTGRIACKSPSREVLSPNVCSRNVLHNWQIPLIEYNQPGDAAHQASNDQYPGVPPCQPMEDKRIDGWRIVVWSPLE